MTQKPFHFHENRDQESQWFAYCVATSSFLMLAADNQHVINMDALKKIAPEEMHYLEDGGVRNPGMVLMIFYALLVMPLDILRDRLRGELKKLNAEFARKAHKETRSTYIGEGDRNAIDYVTHLRNAVSHGHMKCEGNDRVSFTDYNRMTNEHCEMFFAWDDLGGMCDSLLALAGQYFKKYHVRERAS